MGKGGGAGLHEAVTDSTCRPSSLTQRGRSEASFLEHGPESGFVQIHQQKIAPWSSRWFEEISVALIWLVMIWLALIWLALIWVTQIWLALIWVTLIWVTLIWLTLIWLTLIWVTFLSKFLLFSLNIQNFGTHLAHTQMKQIWPNGTFTHYFTTISTY